MNSVRLCETRRVDSKFVQKPVLTLQNCSFNCSSLQLQSAFPVGTLSYKIFMIYFSREQTEEYPYLYQSFKISKNSVAL